MEPPVPGPYCFSCPPHRFEAKQIECLRGLEMDNLGAISPSRCPEFILSHESRVILGSGQSTNRAGRVFSEGGTN